MRESSVCTLFDFLSRVTVEGKDDIVRESLTVVVSRL